MSHGIETAPGCTTVDFRELAEAIDALIIRVSRIERDLRPSPAPSLTFIQCGVCGVFSANIICTRADCPGGQVIYPPNTAASPDPDHEAS